MRFSTMRIAAAIVFVASFAMANTPKQPAPLVPTPLAWGMTVERAQKTLEAKQLAPRYDERRGYFGDGKGGFSHTSEPELHWSVPNGRAEARFQWNATTKAELLDEVQFFTELTGKQLAAELAALERRYGPPTKANDGHRVWVRGGVWLVVIPAKTPDANTKRFYLSVHYRRDDRPAPAP